MKKLLTLVIAGGMLAFYACGPSKEEIAAKEKAIQDSIAMADAMAADAAAAKAKAIQDSTDASNAAIADAAKAKQDSIDAAAAAKKGGKPSKPKEAPKDQPKVGSKRGG